LHVQDTLHGTLLKHFNAFKEEAKTQRADSLPTAQASRCQKFPPNTNSTQNLFLKDLDTMIDILKYFKMRQLFAHLQT